VILWFPPCLITQHGGDTGQSPCSPPSCSGPPSLFPGAELCQHPGTLCGTQTSPAPCWRAAPGEGSGTAPGHCSASGVRSAGTRRRDEAGQTGLRAAGSVCPSLLHLQSPGDKAGRDILLEGNDQSLQSPSLIRNKASLVRHSARGLTAHPQATYAQGSTALKGRDTE